MDPHIRWLRRFVLTRVVERVAVEAALIGVAVGILAAFDGSGRAEAAVLATIGAATAVVLRLLLAVGTNPINHRYLLRWTDPSARLRVAAGPAAPGGEVDGVALGFLVRLERLDDEEPGPGVDVFRVARSRVLVARSDDGELTALSRLSDGRALVTSNGFVPPVETLVVQRAESMRGRDTATGVVLTHLSRLRELRAVGIEDVGSEPGAVVALLRTEWEAWQQLGPIVGPLVALGPRRPLRVSLQIDVPPQLVLERTIRPRPGRQANKPRAAEPTAGGGRRPPAQPSSGAEPTTGSRAGSTTGSRPGAIG